MTDGTGGHHKQGGATLARRRKAEAEAAAAVAGIEYRIFDNPDGKLQPTLANREEIIRLIRTYDPDIVFTHRPNDYHPDHRYTSRLVQDAAYMVTVPNICPNTSELDSDPVIVYLHDEFEKPVPFSPDIVLSIDDVADQQFEMLDCHESQMYEWLPYTADMLEEVPNDTESRREWLRGGELPTVARLKRVADQYRDALIEKYGESQGESVVYAEAFEGCEYGRPLTDENIDELFPFE